MYIAKIFWRWDMSLSVRSQIRIYVVSLPENEDRRAHIRAQFDRFALEFEFVDAIVVAKTGGVDSSRIIGHLSPGEVSCLLSHRLVYEKILSSSDETAIVIEDDVIISFEFANFVRNWSSSKFEMSNYVLFLFWAYYLEEDCELVSKFVDNLILKNTCCSEVYQIVSTPAHLSGTYGYFLDRSAAVTLLSVHPGSYADDWYRFKRETKSLEYFVLSSPLIRHPLINNSTLLGGHSSRSIIRMPWWQRFVMLRGALRRLRRNLNCIYQKLRFGYILKSGSEIVVLDTLREKKGSSYTIFECDNVDSWDDLISNFSGHPLQSAIWGGSKGVAGGIGQILFCMSDSSGKVVTLARVEERTVPFLGKVAWVPKGPVGNTFEIKIFEDKLRAELECRNFIALITDHYAQCNLSFVDAPRTIWIDLALGLAVLEKNLDSQWRYGTRRALREGVVVRTTTDPADVSAFFRLCEALSNDKRFTLPGSEPLMQELIRSSLPESGVGMTLYVAEVEGVIAGGAFIARSGKHLHYFWGASDRIYSKYRVSEALQWQVIQDGVAAGMTRYDLEGIDPVGNPGVCQFKRKMGGKEVALRGQEVTPLSLMGRVAVAVGRRLGKIA